jgi:hypothetical protein
MIGEGRLAQDRRCQNLAEKAASGGQFDRQTKRSSTAKPDDGRYPTWISHCSA